MSQSLPFRNHSSASTVELAAAAAVPGGFVSGGERILIIRMHACKKLRLSMKTIAAQLTGKCDLTKGGIFCNNEMNQAGVPSLSHRTSNASLIKQQPTSSLSSTMGSRVISIRENSQRAAGQAHQAQIDQSAC